MRILAPLLVLALVGLVALRWMADPRRDRERTWIAGSWDLALQRPDVKERLTGRLEGHLERYGDEAGTRWFAARAWMKIGEVGRAIDAVWTSPDLAAAPGTAHRFGSLLLRVLGFVDDARLRQPRTGAAMATLVLAEGGDEEAAAWLDEFARARIQGGYLSELYGTFLYSTRSETLRVADGLRARGEPIADVIAALLAVGPEPYPERGDDMARLEEIVLRDADRRQQRVVWATACVALGRSEDARALVVLEGLHARLSRSKDPLERDDAAVVAAGLLAGGRWSMRGDLSPYLGSRSLEADVRLWYAEAVQHRLARGDPQARAAWVGIWQSLLTHPDSRLAERVATAFLLRDAQPPPQIPLDWVLGPLEDEDAPITMHAIAGAWRYRNAEPAGRDTLLRVLRQLEEGGWKGDDLLLRDPLWISPILTVCRALTLYDPSLHDPSARP